MNGSLGQRIARTARNWTRSPGRQLTLVGSLVACLLLVAAAPVMASARPTPGGISDPLGRDTWTGWSVKAPVARPVSGIWFDLRPPQILAPVASIARPYAVDVAGNVATVVIAYTVVAGRAARR